VLSQQHTGQTSPAILASVLGNIGTLICFRTGAKDAPLLSAQLGGVDIRDLINQSNHRAFVRMLIDGQPSKAFTMTTLPPPIREKQTSRGLCSFPEIGTLEQ
jgi:hypothetical protein